MPDTSLPAFEPATVEPAQFSCRLTRTETASQPALTGELDIATVPELDRALCRAAADAALVILDLRELVDLPPAGATAPTLAGSVPA